MLARIANVLVWAIRDHPDVMFDAQVRNERHLRAREHAPRGIVRRVEEQATSLRGDQAGELIQIDLKPMARGRQENGSRAGQPHLFREGYPVGRRNDHLVSALKGDEDGVEEGLLSSRGEANLLGAVIAASLLGDLSGEPLAQLPNAKRIRILSPTSLNGLPGRLLDGRARVLIEFAGGEVDDADALRLQLSGTVAHARRLGSTERPGAISKHGKEPRSVRIGKSAIHFAAGRYFRSLSSRPLTPTRSNTFCMLTMSSFKTQARPAGNNRA